MEIIAHRGASHDAPENTLAAVNLAWKQQADAVEVDVHICRDGRVVVIHDDNTRKIAGVKRKIRHQTWAELQTLEVGRWKAARWSGERIPDLAQVLAAVPAGKRLFIEVKCGTQFVAGAREVLESQTGRQIVVIGFSFDLMKRVKASFPMLEVCWIVEFKRRFKTGRWSPSPAAVIEAARATRLDGLDVGAKGPITREFVGKAKEAGLNVYVWTVDSPAMARKLFDAGVDGITTNRPGWMREQLCR
jgi:glycerophosphoryl diester phosphodiesterase